MIEIEPGYDNPRPNPLSWAEGAELTIALGAAHKGDDYSNADVLGRVLHFGGGGYLDAQRDRDPEAFTAKIDNQVDELQELIAPYIGRWATAKHNKLGVKNESGWDLWERLYGRSEVMHTSGIILGVAGVIMDRIMIFDYDYPGDVSHARESSYHKNSFKIGVLLDTTHTTPAFCYGVEAPDTDRMLVPVRGFPRHRESFSGLWSWQLSGVDNK